MRVLSNNIDIDNAIILIEQVLQQLLQPVNKDITCQQIEDSNDNNADRLTAALARLSVNRWAK